MIIFLCLIIVATLSALISALINIGTDRWEWNISGKVLVPSLIIIVSLSAYLTWRLSDAQNSSQSSIQGGWANIPLDMTIIFILTIFFIVWLLFQAKPKIQEGSNSYPSEVKLLWQHHLKGLKSKVKQRLDDSLHHQVVINIPIQEQPEQVGRISKSEVVTNLRNTSILEPKRLLRLFKNRSTESLKPTDKIIKVLQKTDINGRLLILGEPGAGKTTTLLTLAIELIEQAEEGSNAPVPIILELSAWRENHQRTENRFIKFLEILRLSHRADEARAVAPQKIEDWLVAQVEKQFSVNLLVSRDWLKSAKILPLLDGLDELGIDRQIKAVEAINEYLSENPLLPLVVCCRSEEYAQGGKKLEELNGAICLQPLADDQIREYLQAFDPKLWNAIQQETELKKLLEPEHDGKAGILRNPFMLNIMVVAYQGKPIQTQQELFEAYIEQQLEPRIIRAEQRLIKREWQYQPGKEPSKNRTKHYIHYLAEQLEGDDQTEFLIEDLQPGSCLNTPAQRFKYTRYVWLIRYMFFACILVKVNYVLGIILLILGCIFIEVILRSSLLRGSFKRRRYSNEFNHIAIIQPFEIIALSPQNLVKILFSIFVEFINFTSRLICYFFIATLILTPFGILILIAKINPYMVYLYASIISFRCLLFLFISMLFTSLSIILLKALQSCAANSTTSLHYLPVNLERLTKRIKKFRVVLFFCSSMIISISVLYRMISNYFNPSKPFGYYKISSVSIESMEVIISKVIVEIEKLRELVYREVPLLMDAIISVVIYGLIIGFVFALLIKLRNNIDWRRSLTNKNIEIKKHHTICPNQLILKSVVSFLLFTFWFISATVVSCLIDSLLFRSHSISLTQILKATEWGLLIGLTISFCLALFPVVQHLSLRMVLQFDGLIPYEYRKFLDYAVERKLMQRVGGNYRFIHKLLLEHFSQMN